MRGRPGGRRLEVVRARDGGMVVKGTRDHGVHRQQHQPLPARAGVRVGARAYTVRPCVPSA